MKTVNLDRILVEISQYFSREYWDGLRDNCTVEPLFRFGEQVGLRFRTYLYGSGKERWRVEYPATWWEHFKQRWFPAWALRRWPVRKTIEEGDVFARVCPHVTFPSRESCLQFLAYPRLEDFDVTVLSNLLKSKLK